MKGPSENGELFVVLEYMKGGQVDPPRALSQKLEFFIRQLPPLPKHLLNSRWWPSRVQSQGTPRRSPEGLLQWGSSQ